MRRLPILLLCLSVACQSVAVRQASAQTGAGAELRNLERSTTGPVPPPGVVLQTEEVRGPRAVVIDGVPGYVWRHGCGPTALAMVIAYHDMHGYPDLIDGDSSTQTPAVDQLIASQRGTSDPGHYEDYSEPLDDPGTGILPDLSEQPLGDEHSDDCMADFMRTSFSAANNYYGWSWAVDMGPAFADYVAMRNQVYTPWWEELSYPDELTWEALKRNIDDGSPMVFLVDTDGDQSTDHFVTVVGYREDTVPEYGCLTTWYPPDVVQWFEFRGMGSGWSWGISRGWTFDPDYTLVVDAGGGGDYSTLQEAIDAAPQRATILVNPGVYSGAGNFDLETGGKQLRVCSAAGPESTAIDCGGTGRGFYIHENETESTVIEGFTITNGSAVTGGGIWVHWTCSPTLRDLVIEDCLASDDGGGLSVSGSAAPAISNVTILGCTAADQGGGVHFRNASPTLENITLHGNSAASGGGMYCYGTSSPLISNAIIAASASGGAMSCDAGAAPEVVHCCVHGNAGGDDLCGDAHDNLYQDPYLCSPSTGDLTLSACSPCLPDFNIWGELIGANGQGGCTTGVTEPGNAVAAVLHAARPNPFGPATTFALDLPLRARVRLSVFDTAGRLVRTILDGAAGPGSVSAEWDGTDSEGRRVSSGVYFVRLEASGKQQTGRAVLLR